MKKMYNILALVVFVALVIGCEKENILLEGRQENNLVLSPLMYEASIEEGGRNYQLGLRTSEVDFNIQSIFSVGTISRGAAGPVLYLGIAKYPAHPANRETFPFSLKFRVDEMNPDRAPTEAELTTYFSPGREFSFGEENGGVALGILLLDTTREERRSRSDFMDVQEGTVTVERIEPFVASLSEFAGGDREYLMITFSFAGSIGVYDQEEELAAERRGIPFVASRSAQVTGTTTLVLAATPG